MVIRENFRQTDCIFSLSSMDGEIREENLQKVMQTHECILKAPC